MNDKSESQNAEQKKSTRIEYLENHAKWNLFSLELLASLGELHHLASQDRDPHKIFEIAYEHLIKIVKFDSVAFYLVDEPDSDFTIKDAFPKEHEKSIQEEVDRRVNDGSFAWAVNQNRPVVVKSVDGGQSLVLHVLATKQRVRGMFAGLIRGASPRMEETTQYTLSIILQNTANALESMALYKLFQETNTHLESKVRERTLDLEDHMIQMKEEIAFRKLAEESLWVARQEVESALKAKTDLLTQFSHELKTPIQSILGYGEIIRGVVEKSGLTHLNDIFEIIQSTGGQLLDLIDSTRGLASSLKHPLDLKPQSFSISGVLSGASTTLFPMAKKNRNKMEMKSNPDIGSMVSYESRVRQILLNIIGNACKFTEKGKIVIEAFIENVADEDWVCFRVSDNGRGMVPEQIRKIFQMHEVSASQPNSVDGTGMGLSFSKRLCAMLGGNIQVKSELGKGSVFTIRLPRDIQSFIARQRRHPKKAEIQKPLTKPRVLTDYSAAKESSSPKVVSQKSDSEEILKIKEICIVDEDPANSKILCNILRGEGWSAQAVELSGLDLGRLEMKIPDLVILCLGVSSDRALEFISELREKETLSSVPLLIFTAKELSDNEKNMFKGQVQGVLYKGVCTRDELLDQIINLMRK